MSKPSKNIFEMSREEVDAYFDDLDAKIASARRKIRLQSLIDMLGIAIVVYTCCYV